MKRKICLFTAHSPSIGGGSIILRSLIDSLTEASISWYYLANEAVKGREQQYLGRGIMNDGLQSIWRTWQMLSKKPCSPINILVERLLEIDCDLYWIVSHNEGLRVAIELAKRQTKRPVHLTFHDDWAGALCARSARYKILTRLAKKLTITALKEATSFDVISVGMQNYYYGLSGRIGKICHRYINQNLLEKVIKNKTPESVLLEIHAGHIGSLYSKKDFLHFVALFHAFASKRRQVPVLSLWGCHLTTSDIPVRFRNVIRFYENLPEEEVIPKLSQCDFVYAMYPMSKSLRYFAMTSLPTKLSSYVKAGRPIFGHAPSESTLAEFIQSTKTGVIWNKENESGYVAFGKLMALNIRQESWEKARERYFGDDNLNTMRKIFSFQNKYNS